MKCPVYSGTLYCGHLGDLVKCPVYSGTLYCGHLGDLVKCPVYSGTPLLWTPRGPGEVSCIERCPHFRGKFPLRNCNWDIAKCPQYSGVLISGVSSTVEGFLSNAL